MASTLHYKHQPLHKEYFKNDDFLFRPQPQPRPRSASGSSSKLIPDLRFEYSYLKSISRHVRTRPLPPKKRDGQDGDEIEEGNDDGGVKYEVIGVDWNKVLWITTRDLIISPFLQGAVWGVAQLFIRPVFSSIGSFFKFTSKKPTGPKVESEFTKRMRAWARSLKP